MLSEQGAVFVGQSVSYPGHALFGTLEDAQVPMSQRKELPVFEDSQLGISTGIAMMGNLVVSIFPRIDFLICACNQLVNHLDKWNEMSHGEWQPKVIIRTAVGAKEPLYPGAQHCQDHSDALREMLTTIKVLTLDTPERVIEYYKYALTCKESVVLVEYNELY